jgi:hypothetical protein
MLMIGAVANPHGRLLRLREAGAVITYKEGPTDPPVHHIVDSSWATSIR